MKFFPKEEPIDYHRVLIIPLPFVVEDKSTARIVNIIVLSILALGGLVTLLIVLGLLGVELPFDLIMPYA
jgi:hypothetical protein